MLVSVGRMLRHLHRQQLARLVVDSSAYECREKRVRSSWPALQLRVRLGADDERVYFRRVFDEFDQMPIGRSAGNAAPALGDSITIDVGDLVAVPVPL